MSKTLIAWVVGYFGGLSLGILHPIYPLASYLLFYYFPPHVNWWGRPLPDLRYSLLASVVLAISVVLCQGSLDRLKEAKNPALPWLILFGVNAVVVTLWAVDRTRSWLWTVALLKLIALYILMPAVIRTPAHLDAFGAMHVAGATYWGWKAWDDPKRSQGRLEDVGGPDTQNDNAAAGHLLTVIPFGAMYVLTARKKGWRVAATVGTAFIVNVFILCNSRGATVGFLAAGLAAMVLIGRGRRARILGVGVVGLLAMWYLTDDTFVRRQLTTLDPQDNSAQSRLVMWQAGLEMVRDHPLGAGGRAFHALSPRYIPEIVEESGGERSGHNSYTQLMTEWGVQGTILYVGFMCTTFLLLHRIRKRTPEDSWFVHRAVVIQVALVGTMTAAFFSNRLYGESIYWMCALAFALHRIQETHLAPVSESAAQQPQEASKVRAGHLRPDLATGR